MNLNAAALKLMAAKGLTLEDVAEIVAANEVTRDPTAAERQARCRARKREAKSQRDVTRAPLNDKVILNPADNPTPDGVGPRLVTNSRGTRLPADWSLPTEWAKWAQDRRRWSATDVAEEALLFANYWHARSGAGAVHRDWFKTWQNWTIRSHRPDGKQAGKIQKTAQQYREDAEWFVRHGQPDRADECRRKAIQLEQVRAA